MLQHANVVQIFDLGEHEGEYFIAMEYVNGPDLLVLLTHCTHEHSLVRLREAGVDDRGIARLRSPIGVDIGARTPEETAVSIVAEIVALRTGRSAQALSASSGPIHD